MGNPGHVEQSQRVLGCTRKGAYTTSALSGMRAAISDRCELVSSGKLIDFTICLFTAFIMEGPSKPRSSLMRRHYADLGG